MVLTAQILFANLWFLMVDQMHSTITITHFTDSYFIICFHQNKNTDIPFIFFLRTIGFRTVFLQIVYGFVSSQRLWFQTTIYAICWSRTKTRLEFVHFSCGWLLFNCMRNGIHLRSINSKSVTLSIFEHRCIQMRKVFARVAGIFGQIFGPIKMTAVWIYKINVCIYREWFSHYIVKSCTGCSC